MNPRHRAYGSGDENPPDSSRSGGKDSFNHGHLPEQTRQHGEILETQSIRLDDRGRSHRCSGLVTDRESDNMAIGMFPG